MDPAAPPAGRPELRLLEPLGALSLVTDLGRGRAVDHALRCSLVAVTLSERLELAPAEASRAFYVSLLRSIGCTATSHEYAVALGGDDIAVRRKGDLVDPTVPREVVRLVVGLAAGRPLTDRPRAILRGIRHGAETAAQAARADCEVASHLALQLGLEAAVGSALYEGFERWDGRGGPSGLAGDDISPLARLATVAASLVMLLDELGIEAGRAVLERWSGGVLDPSMTALVLEDLDALAAVAREPEPLAAALEREPPPVRRIHAGDLDGIALAFATVADLKSTWLLGHSRGVAELAAGAAALAGLPDERVAGLRQAALLHDMGRVAVPTGVWDRDGVLSSADWELVRLHAYHGERILARSGVLAPLARIVGMHHERTDASGYHRGCGAAELDLGCGLLAAADVYHALTEARPHRPARGEQSAARTLADAAIHPEAVAAVLAAAGQPVSVRRSWPAGLTDREVEVLRLIARGALIKQVAVALGISASTVHTHLAHVYEKAGVSTRAAAAMFAMEHGLLQPDRQNGL